MSDLVRLVGGRSFYPYNIPYSCRFNDDDSAKTYNTPGASPTDNKKRSTSLWIKRCNLGINTGIIDTYVSGTAFEGLIFDTNDCLQWIDYNGGTYINKITTQRFRDTSAWYHILIVLDTTEAVQADRTKVYVNGTEVTSFSTNTSSMALNATHALMFLHNSGQANVGFYYDYTYKADCYLAEVINVDGQALTPSSFGQFSTDNSKIFVPIKYAGTYGNNGFRLDFSNSADFGEDQSGNNNDFTDSGLAANDQVLDTPTNNYCTLNLLDLYGSVLRNGNLESNEVSDNHTQGTIGVSEGKWEWKFTANSANLKVGIFPTGEDQYAANPLTSQWYYGADGNFYVGVTGQGYGALTFTTTDVIRVQLDLDAGTLRFFKNDVDQGVAATGLNDGTVWVPYFGCAGSGDYSVDFGQLGFTPASGFKTLCLSNMDDPSILNPAEGADIKTWLGDASDDDEVVTDLEFNPSTGCVFMPRIYGGVKNNYLYDTVRGVTKRLTMNEVDIEVTEAGNVLQQFTSSGIEVGNLDPGLNDNANNYMGLFLRIGAAYGLDVQTFEGTGVAKTESHDLGDVPEMIFLKNRDVARNWAVYHHWALNNTDPETDYGILNTSAGFADLNTMWNDTAPTASVFSVGTANETNESGQSMLAYLFRSIPGYSKCFHYVGNGNADGAFIFLGFRPMFVWIKKINVADSWVYHNAVRDPYNPVSKRTLLEATNAEVDDTLVCDFLSNGIKIRHISSFASTAAGDYGVYAVAEQPFKYANAR